MTNIKESQAVVVSLIRENRLPEAESLCQQVLDLQPNHPQSMFLMGIISQKSRKLDLALQWYQKARPFAPNDANLLTNLTDTYVARGEFKPAEEMLVQAVAQIQSSKQLFELLQRVQSRIYSMTDNCSYLKQHYGLERFVFSDESAALTDAEYHLALTQLENVRKTIQRRDALKAQGPEDHNRFQGRNVWRAGRSDGVQLDGEVRDMYTPFNLLMKEDPEIIAKLRLYGHFSGYQHVTFSSIDARPWVSKKFPKNLDTFVAMLVPREDSGFRRIMMLRSHLPAEMRLSFPQKFGEMGWLVDGQIVNADTYYYLDQLAIIYENGVLDRLQSTTGAAHVMEIGGGIGALAYLLMSKVKNVRYVIVDLPESLAFSAVYLNVLFPELQNHFVTSPEELIIHDTPGFTFVPNDLHQELRRQGKTFGLAVNAASMREMSVDQVDDYCVTLSWLLGGTGVFFEQNWGPDPTRGDIDTASVIGRHFKNRVNCQTLIAKASTHGIARLWSNAAAPGV